MRPFVFIVCWILLAACSEFPSQPVVDLADVGEDADGADASGDATDDTGGDVGDSGPVDGGSPCETDEDCDDESFCNGVETCSPGDPGADRRGCVRGEAPVVDDGIECTVDACDDGAGQVLHDSSGCGCQLAGELCRCDRGDDCPVLGPCDEAICLDKLECEARRVDDSRTCDDGISCTVNTACTPDGECLGELDHDLCNDGSWCNGVESCAPADSDTDQGCVAGDAPPVDDGLDCTEHTCEECPQDDADCVPGLHGTIRLVSDACDCGGDDDCVPAQCWAATCVDGACEAEPADAGTPCENDDPCQQDTQCDGSGNCRGARICGCESIADCAPRPCMERSCVDGECVYEPGQGGAPCTTECAEQPDGTCSQGACVPLPEGPTGTADCDDQVDNDCDGLTDRLDAGCGVATTVQVGGESTAGAGLDAGGARLALVHFEDDDDLNNQHRNTYCVAQRLRFETEFEDQILDELVTSGGPDGAVTGGRRDRHGNTGVLICQNGYVDIGRLELPPRTDPIKTFLVEVEVGAADSPLEADEVLFIGWRSELLPQETWIPAAAPGPEVVRDGGRVRFMIENGAGMGSLQLRLFADSGPGNCAHVDAVRIYEVPRLARVDEEPQWREYLTWTYDGRTEPAYQGFESGDPDDFLSFEEGAFTTQLEGDGVLDGSLGLEFEVIEGTTEGRMALPRFVNHPVVDRGNPLILDFGAGLEDAEFLARDAFHVIAVPPGGDQALVASTVPDDLDIIAHHMDLASPLDEMHRYLTVLPETMKVRAGSYISLAVFPEDHRVDHLLDAVHVYWFTRPAQEDVTVELEPSSPPGHGAIPLRVRSALPGTVRVRCYWQVPDDGGYPTVESEQHEVVFQ